MTWKVVSCATRCELRDLGLTFRPSRSASTAQRVTCSVCLRAFAIMSNPIRHRKLHDKEPNNLQNATTSEVISKRRQPYWAAACDRLSVVQCPPT